MGDARCSFRAGLLALSRESDKTGSAKMDKSKADSARIVATENKEDASCTNTGIADKYNKNHENIEGKRHGNENLILFVSSLGVSVWPVHVS
jgi:hypothetical protein